MNSGIIKDKKTGRFIKTLQDKVCTICKKSFHPRFSTVKMCSKKCMGINASNILDKKITKECSFCKKEYRVGKSRENTTRFCSHLCSDKSRIGKGSSRWKGGERNTFKLAIRECFQYRQWRSDIFTRDDFTCQICFFRGLKINADHIKPFAKILEENNIQNLEDALNCAELWNINNGRTLCISCHRETDTYGGRGQKRLSYKKHNHEL
jgi:hypothetical protein